MCVCADGSDLEVDARLQPKAAYAGSGGGHKQSSLAEMVKSESAGDAGQDHHGENLSFAVFNSQSKAVTET